MFTHSTIQMTEFSNIRFLLRFVWCMLLFMPIMLYGQFIESSVEFNIDHLHESKTFMGGGIGLIDVNNDNLIDVYLTGGYESHDKLFLNVGNNNFKDISLTSGVQVSTHSLTTFGVIAGDIDNDGCDDLFITTHDDDQPNLLLLGDCNANFVDSSLSAGIDDNSASTSATFLDFNLDGHLDIYVTNYVEELDFTRNSEEEVIGYNHLCYPNFLYLNNGDGTFSEVAEEYEVADVGCGLAVTASDYDLDGDPDIYIANDFGEWVVPNKMYQNNGVNGFVDVSEDTGLDAPIYGMGIAPGDYDNDGDIDYYLTNIGANVLLMNNGDQTFEDQAVTLGVDNALSEMGTNATSWGALFCDFDNDGFKDLYVSNGYIPAAPFLNNTLQDDNKLYLNSAANTFADVSADFGLNSTLINRGVTYGDINNDGLMDIITASVVKTDIGNGSANVLVYINNSSSESNWLQVKLEGTISNVNAFGSIVKVYANNKEYIQEKYSGGSHASQSTDILHFGMGDVQSIDSIMIHWPSGSNSLFKDVSPNERILIIEESNEYSAVDCNLDEKYRCYDHLSPGCVDEEAFNYNIFATIDDGSCDYGYEEITSIANDEDFSKLKIHPNPFNNEIEVNSPINKRIIGIEVADLNGKVHHEVSLDKGVSHVLLDMSRLKSGGYIMKVIYELSDFDIRYIVKF